MAAPGYTDSQGSAPTYSALLSDGERILELQSSQPGQRTSLPDQYVFQSQRIQLDLGARAWPVTTPCFGYRGYVEGVVSVTTLEYVKSVSVKPRVEATVKTFFMERGVPGGHTKAVLFQRSITLYANKSEYSTTALSYPFSITLPGTGDKSTYPLPPSYVSSIPGVSAEICYAIYVDMTRSGLRWRDSLVVPVLYLPRSYTPPYTQTLPLYSDTSLLSVAQGMEELHLAPKLIPKQSQTNLPPSTEIQAKVALPVPLIVASGDRIPFIITIHSQSQALVALYTEMLLQLVKVTRIKAPQKTLHKEEILASGDVHDSDDLGNDVRILRGEVGSG